MNWKRIIPAAVLAVFAVDTALVVAEHGYLGFFERAIANTATQLMLFDLVIALTLALIWMARDAKHLGRTVRPFVVLTLVFGAAGPLAYLATRRVEEVATEPTAVRAAAH